MSVRLWVLRHGEAERDTAHDPERALTERGARHARAAGEWLAQAASAELRVLVSPYKRAQQTAALAMPQKKLFTVDWLVPDFNPFDVIAALANEGSRELLLVSHQPLVSALIGVLVESDFRAGPAMETAALAELRAVMVAPGCATLSSLRSAPDYSRSVAR